MASTAQIPVIDISSDSEDVAQQVLSAASTHGFLFVENDGVTIPPQDIAAMFELSREFFHLPEEEKAEWTIHSSKAGLNRGWVRMQGESLDPETTKQGDPKEAFNIAPPHPTLQPLPPPLSTSSPLLFRFHSACHTLCTRILTLLATALQIEDPDWFAARHDASAEQPSGTILRLLYYPSVGRACEERGGDERTGKQEKEKETQNKRILAGAHSDYGSLTLLFRLPTTQSDSHTSTQAYQAKAEGLEVLTPSRTWAPVPINPSPASLADPPILVNIGDLLSFWTNGMLKSTVHRVVFESDSGSSSSSSSGDAGAGAGAGAGVERDDSRGAGGGDGGEAGREDRYSIAYFLHPVNSAALEPVPSSVIRTYGEKGFGAAEVEAQRRKVGLPPVDGGGEETEISITAQEHLERRLRSTYRI